MENISNIVKLEAEDVTLDKIPHVEELMVTGCDFNIQNSEPVKNVQDEAGFTDDIDQCRADIKEEFIQVEQNNIEDATTANQDDTEYDQQQSTSTDTAVQKSYSKFGKSYKCSVCWKKFTRPSHLEIHQWIHTGERKFTCEICKKTFTQSGTLNTHLKSHTGEKKHECHICEKTFTHLGSLKRHQYTHTGEKKYTCDFCGKAFSHAHHLKTHYLRHTGEKSHECDICGKKFTQSCHLKRHQLTHT